MSRLGAMILWDIATQIRSHFYTATLLTATVVCALTLAIPQSPLPPRIVALLIFVDPAVVGLTLVGAFVLMERGARTLSALSVTPLPGWVYVASKIISFTLLGVLCGMLIGLVATRASISWPRMTLALVLSNAVAVLIGFALITRAKSVNAFLANILITSLVLVLPLLAFFNVVPWLVGVGLKLIPSYMMLVLLADSAQQGALSLQVVAAYGYLLVWLAALWWWALREYDRHVITGGL